MKDYKPQYTISAIENAFQIIEMMAEKRSDVNATDISTRFGMTKANVHKILQTLKEIGYVDQNEETNRYFLTLKSLQIAYQVANRRNFLDLYYPYAIMYGKQLDVPITLVSFSNDQAVVIYATGGVENVSNVSMLGKTLSPYASAAARVMLAELDDQEVMRLLKVNPLIPLTEYTIINANEILEKVQQVRNAGYAVVEQECIYGCTTFAFPLRDQRRKAIGCFNLNLHYDVAHRILTPEIISEIRNTLEKIRISDN